MFRLHFLGWGCWFFVFCFVSFPSTWLMRKWTKWNQRSITPIYLRWNNSSFGLQWIRERQEPWWRRNLQTLVNILVPFTFSWVRVLVFCFLVHYPLFGCWENRWNEMNVQLHQYIYPEITAHLGCIGFERDENNSEEEIGRLW